MERERIVTRELEERLAVSEERRREAKEAAEEREAELLQTAAELRARIHAQPTSDSQPDHGR